MTIPGSIPITHGPAELHLLPQRAIHWPAERAVVVADVHLGKGTAFRTMGVPVPTGGSAKDLQRLGDLLTMTGANRLIILGDLVHARRSHQAELTNAMMQWRKDHSRVDVLLVRGNHDRNAGRLAAALQIDEADGSTVVGGLTLRHHPPVSPDGTPTLAGHVHPVVAVSDFDRSMVRLPCFVFNPDGVGILPSFGTFTGGAITERVDGQRRFACASTRVIAIP